MTVWFKTDDDIPVFWFVLGLLLAAVIAVFYSGNPVMFVFFGMGIANFLWGLSDFLPNGVYTKRYWQAVFKLCLAMVILLGVYVYNEGPLQLV